MTAAEGKQILLVDDDETIVTPFQLILQNEGYRVDTAVTGKEALGKTEETDYQMVILDIKLPDILGTEVASKIREQNDKIHIIIMTGFPTLINSIETIDIGIDEILLKPIEPDELLRVIKDSFYENEKIC
jgi:DNA-binding response OmpR family regulator